MAQGSFISERDLIRRISTILGSIVNDDCAVLDSGDRYLVATTDMLHRKSDFPEVMTPWQIGWMTVAVNLSDVAAMGAEPSGVLVATGIPQGTDLAFIDGIFSGFSDCTGAFGTRVLGGDMDSTDELNLTGFAMGFVEKDLILMRSGASPGDILCTTGTLGAAGAGLLQLQMGDDKGAFVKNLLEPVPKIKEGRALALSRSVTAMMDNSDGLALSLSDLSEVSSVGFVLKEESIPLALGIEEAFGRAKGLELAVRAGGDFELIFTVKPSRIEAASKAVDLTILGHAVEEGLWMETGGKMKRIEPGGYEHSVMTSASS
jgi:thiamine-monophosphate kinase